MHYCSLKQELLNAGVQFPGRFNLYTEDPKKSDNRNNLFIQWDAFHLPEKNKMPKDISDIMDTQKQAQTYCDLNN